MNVTSLRTNRTIAVQRTGGVEFPASAKSVSIFDGRGRLLWSFQRTSEQGPILWDEVTIHGEPLGVGSYMCKMIFLDGQMIYVPFVFVR